MKEMSNNESQWKQHATLLEMPVQVTIGGRTFQAERPCLGQLLMLQEEFRKLGIGAENAHTPAIVELLRVMVSRKDKAAKIVAILIAKRRKLKEAGYMAWLTRHIEKHLTTAETAALMVSLRSADDVEELMRATGIADDAKRMQRVMRQKETGGSITFGGVSLWGSLIDAACERYGWTVDYVVWGVSYANLRLMLSDQTKTIYLTDKERKRIRISTDGEFINADDPKNAARIAAMFND